VQVFKTSRYKDNYYKILNDSEMPFHRKLGYFSYFTSMTKASLKEDLVRQEMEREQKKKERVDRTMESKKEMSSRPRSFRKPFETSLLPIGRTDHSDADSSFEQLKVKA